MPTIDNLPRPWLLAAMTGVPVGVLVGMERAEPDDGERVAKPPLEEPIHLDQDEYSAPKSSTH